MPLRRSWFQKGGFLVNYGSTAVGYVLPAEMPGSYNSAAVHTPSQRLMITLASGRCTTAARRGSGQAGRKCQPAGAVTAAGLVRFLLLMQPAHRGVNVHLL